MANPATALYPYVETAIPQPAADPGQPLDMVHFAKQTLGDWSLGVEVLRLFEDMQRTYFGRLETSTTRNDLLVNLHALKGAAAGVGAFALAQLVRTAEDELKAGSPVNPERIADIEMAVEEVSTFIDTLIESQPLEPLEDEPAA
jgi:HPt (histidine-containing phosphotransfer) domain-containing protein